jgi:hypothetical protein
VVRNRRFGQDLGWCADSDELAPDQQCKAISVLAGESEIVHGGDDCQAPFRAQTVNELEDILLPPHVQ